MVLPQLYASDTGYPCTGSLYSLHCYIGKPVQGVIYTGAAGIGEHPYNYRVRRGKTGLLYRYLVVSEPGGQKLLDDRPTTGRYTNQTGTGTLTLPYKTALHDLRR